TAIEMGLQDGICPEEQLNALGLVVNAIVLRNTRYMNTTRQFTIGTATICLYYAVFASGHPRFLKHPECKPLLLSSGNNS
ncbi:MAG: hypothetical protein M0Z36_06725, partial [Thermaerobacter sp.]|nr:hypothetical protein [Thermaerobacter sp.]